MYAQNEIQSSVELNNDEDYSVPDSFAYQLGTEVSLPVGEGYLTSALEGIYTTPFCYLKQTQAASLARVRENSDAPYAAGRIASWIGTPFGPDALGGELSAKYEIPAKFNAGLKYLFMAHGTNSFGLFNQKNDRHPELEYYYPQAIYLQDKEDGINSAEKTRAMRTYNLTETIQYTNRISLSGEYYFMKNLSAQAKAAYSFIFNNKGHGGEFAHGLEFTVNAKYSIF